MEEKEKNNKKNYFKNPIILALIILGIIISAIAIIKNNKTKKDETSFTINYIGIEEQETYIYVNFEIKNNVKFKIKSSDFAVLIGDTPISANQIYLGTSGTMTPSGYISNDIVGTEKEVINETIKIQFNKTKGELDKPITFFYKGIKLELGKETQFKN